MTTEMPESLAQFLTRPNYAVMATLASDGRPVAVPSWYRLEPDGRIMLNFDATRVRLRHVRRDPRIALDVLDPEDWYRHVSLQLEAVEFVDDEGLRDIDALSRRYGLSPYDDRERPRTTVHAEIRRWMGWESGAKTDSL